MANEIRVKLRSSAYLWRLRSGDKLSPTFISAVRNHTKIHSKYFICLRMFESQQEKIITQNFNFVKIRFVASYTSSVTYDLVFIDTLEDYHLFTLLFKEIFRSIHLYYTYNFKKVILCQRTTLEIE